MKHIRNSIKSLLFILVILNFNIVNSEESEGIDLTIDIDCTPPNSIGEGNDT